MVRKNEYEQEITQFIGNRIYSLRLAKGLSCDQLGKMVGVTAQQMQKYEKGINRITVGRMVLMARVLGKNIDYFYEKLEGKTEDPVLTQHQRMCLEVSRNFMKIVNPKHQEALHMLTKSLV